MAKEETVAEIIDNSVDRLVKLHLDSYNFEFEDIYDLVRDFVYDKKMQFFVENNILYDDIPINCCYACQTSCCNGREHNCDKCPVDLKGFCEEDNTKYVTKGNLYDRYIKYITHIVKNHNKEKYIKQAQKMALSIANAKLQYEVEEI